MLVSLESGHQIRCDTTCFPLSLPLSCTERQQRLLALFNINTLSIVQRWHRTEWNDINFIMIQMLTEAKQIWPPYQSPVSRRVKLLSAVLNALRILFNMFFAGNVRPSHCALCFDFIRDNAIICIELVNKSQIIKHIESHFWSVVFIVTRCAINRCTAWMAIIIIIIIITEPTLI